MLTHNRTITSTACGTLRIYFIVITVVNSFNIRSGQCYFLYINSCIYFIILLSNKALLFNRLWAPAITELLLKFTTLEIINSNTQSIIAQWLTMLSHRLPQTIYWIEPLTGPRNYAMWKIKMIDILTGQDLWEYVDGTTTFPSDLAAQSGWCKKDRLELSTIRLRVADKMLVYVASSTLAKEAWDTINSLLEVQGALGIILAR